MWSAEGGGSVHSKIVLFHQGSTELRRCENCVFFLPVNILTGVARRLLGPHDTLPCVLIKHGENNCHVFVMALPFVELYSGRISSIDPSYTGTPLIVTSIDKVCCWYARTLVYINVNSELLISQAIPPFLPQTNVHVCACVSIPWHIL